jgi:hypothetical protein
MATGVALILCALALLHAYWGIVGVSGRSIALPEIDGKPTFMPSRLACFSVASALALAALILLWRGGLVSAPVSMAVTTVGTVGVGIVFVLRAIGDFRLRLLQACSRHAVRVLGHARVLAAQLGARAFEPVGSFLVADS